MDTQKIFAKYVWKLRSTNETYTEKVAKSKVCPYSQFVDSRGSLSSPCIGSKCMKWVWLVVNPTPTDYGYCSRGWEE
jgi:hypothetical protein